jgi:TRAP-type uncharacterized transport system substrate-binding protein
VRAPTGSFDETLAFITRKSVGIRKRADLDAKKIASGPGTAVHLRHPSS